MSEPFLAEIVMFGGSFAPRGWAFCQGQLMGIAQNTALFSLLGTTFGGDGVTTFALPNLASRSPIGTGQGPGLQSTVLGEAAGSESLTLTAVNLPTHAHQVQLSIPVTTEDATSKNPAGRVPAATGAPAYATPSNGTGTTITATTSPAGNNQPIPIRNPYLGMNFIICTAGLYPSRN